MVQPSAANKISLAVQDFIYKVADDLTTIVDEALEAFEDAAGALEDKMTPKHVVTNNSIYVDGKGMMTADEIREQFFPVNKQSETAPSKTGGSDSNNQDIDREQLLREVYRYMSRHYVRGYGPHSQVAEDNSAGTNPKAKWVPAYLVKKFLEDVVEKHGHDTSLV